MPAEQGAKLPITPFYVHYKDNADFRVADNPPEERNQELNYEPVDILPIMP
jgi:hypothetical protein